MGKAKFPLMPFAATVPAHASDPRPLARPGESRAHLPALLEALLLALLASLLGRRETLLRGLWHLPPESWAANPATTTDVSTLEDPLRAQRRLEARIDWLLRCLPGLGMALSGTRALPPCPARAARAPPRPA